MKESLTDLLYKWSRLDPKRCLIDSEECIHVVTRTCMRPAGNVLDIDADIIFAGVMEAIRVKGWSADVHFGPVYAHAKVSVRYAMYYYGGEEDEDPAYAALSAFLYALEQNL